MRQRSGTYGFSYCAHVTVVLVLEYHANLEEVYRDWEYGFHVAFYGARTLRSQGSRIKAHVRFLSSDLLEGRGVGTRGGQLTEEYIAAQLAALGARPAGENGTYFQKVPMIGVQTAAGIAIRSH